MLDTPRSDVSATVRQCHMPVIAKHHNSLRLFWEDPYLSVIAEPAGMCEISRVSNPDADYYARNGYVVVKSLVSKADIRELLSLYAQLIVPSRHRFFRQNANAYQANKRSEHGYVRQSFLDIHDYGPFPQFSAAARNIFCAPSMMTGLRRVTGFDT